MPTPHALAGAFASRFARSPRVALVAGAFSHLALDRIPHTDYRLANRKVLLADLAAATLLTDADPTPRARRGGSFGGVLPDLTMVAELRTGLRVTLALHHANHTSIEPPVVVGVLTQLITAGCCSPALAGPSTAFARRRCEGSGRFRIAGRHCTGGGRRRPAKLIGCPAWPPSSMS